MDRRLFLQVLGCGCLSIGVSSCSTVPITDRKQLKLLSEEKLNYQAAKIYEKIKEKEKLITYGSTLNEIKEIGKNMEYSISEYFNKSNMLDPTINFDWEYILIDKKKVKNAWCLPGGKIAIYTGMLEVTKNTNGLAAVMGHEIAHAVAKHSVERASRNVATNVVLQVTDMLTGGKLTSINQSTAGINTVGLLSQIGIMNPFNRKQESEADYLGLIFSSLSGYDIRETTKLWERMKKTKNRKEIPQFMSTHPSPDNRIKKINEWTNQIIFNYPPISKT